MSTKSQIIERVQALDEHQIKELVLEWLAGSEVNLEEFARLLDDGTPEYGEFDERGNFQPLTEPEMAAKSLEVLVEYQLARQGIAHEQVAEWLDSIGSDKIKSYSPFLRNSSGASSPMATG